MFCGRRVPFYKFLGIIFVQVLLHPEQNFYTTFVSHSTKLSIDIHKPSLHSRIKNWELFQPQNIFSTSMYLTYYKDFFHCIQ